MSRITSRHAGLAIVIVIVLGLVVPPFVNVGRYKVRIADSMSRALGRPVTFDKISLRLLPQPGFDFENLIIGDDPSFSAEPMLRAEEVTAYLRMSSLWRGRLEIARLQLSYPSLNLVRRGEGEWNLESLLYRASQSSVAPTTARTPMSRPRFPYIEASDGRINFKYGLEKKVFALTEAKFSLWSPGQDEWRMRLEAKPVRTDIVIADSGLVRAEGSFRRAEMLRDTKLDLQASLEKGQLGQLTRLVWGRDRGWRGALAVDLRVNGTPADLSVDSTASVQDFRRYDIMGGEALQLQTHCTGKFSSVRQSVDNVSCSIPAGSGHVKVSGELSRWYDPAISGTVTAEKVPLDWAMMVARHTKRDLPEDLRAAGNLVGEFKFEKSDRESPATLTGTGQAEGVVLRSSLLNGDLNLGKIQVSAGSTTKGSRSSTAARLDVLPFPVPLGSPTEASASGWFSAEGYDLQLQGDGEVSQIMRLARALGIGVPKFQLRGGAKLNAAIVGPWRGFAQASTTGTMQVKNVTAEIPGLNEPLKIASADITLAENTVTLRKLVASSEALQVNGTAIFPRHCEANQPCTSEVNVQFDDLEMGRVNALLNPRMKKRPWYKLFGSSEEKSLLATWQAKGTIAAKRLELKSLSADKLSTDFELDHGELTLRNIQANVFGGSHEGEWFADFTSDKPTYVGSGTVSKAVIAQLSALTKDSWGTGVLSGTYQVKFAGSTAEELAESVTGEGDFTWRNGQFRHLALDGKASGMKFPQWSGHCQWSSEGFRVSKSKLQAAGSIYGVSGTIQPSRNLRLEFIRGDGVAYQVTGTLDKPQVAAPKAGRTAEASLR